MNIRIDYQVTLTPQDIDIKLFWLHKWRIMRYMNQDKKELAEIIRNVVIGEL